MKRIEAIESKGQYFCPKCNKSTFANMKCPESGIYLCPFCRGPTTLEDKCIESDLPI